MKPYFDTSHLAGVLLLIVSMGWGALELGKASSERTGATKVGGAGKRMLMLPAMAVATAGLYLGPHFVPAAAIRPGAAVFTIGIVLMVAGLVLRGWSIRTLGEYFTGRVMVSADQPVITAGPYRLLRHPSYAGFLLACAGAGLAAANWVSVAVIVLLPLLMFCLRIRAEETAMLATIGEPYREYASAHKRLVPFLW